MGGVDFMSRGNTILNPSSDSELTEEVASAICYFEEEILANNQQNNQARSRSIRLQNIENLKWEEARFKQLSIGRALKIPIVYEEELFYQGGSSAISLKQSSYALMYQNPTSHKFVLEIVSEFPYKYSDPTLPFSGSVLVEDWFGNIKRKYEYINGQLREETEPTNLDSQARYTLNCFTVTYWSCVTVQDYNIRECTIVGYDEYCDIAGTPTMDYSGNGYIPDSNDTAHMGGSGTGGQVLPEDKIRTACRDGYLPTDIGKCEETDDEDKPCPGDTVKNPELAPQKVSGLEGATFGNTRSSGTQYHGGIDFLSSYGSPIYAAFDGFVYNATSGGRLGYIVQIQSQVNGQTILTRYCHLQKDGRVSEGTISAGDIIGYQGDSGNLAGAILDETVDSHLHLEIAEHDGSTGYGGDNFENVDPNEYLGTKLNADGSKEENVECD
ncbi:hypothetical protein BGP76_05205 [Reichenbachiella sp. MSK19-1]|nr:hypothetical protein BGP76_05205 [Reichenbachiella sp. MSK19-1]